MRNVNESYPIRCRPTEGLLQHKRQIILMTVMEVMCHDTQCIESCYISDQVVYMQEGAHLCHGPQAPQCQAWTCQSCWSSGCADCWCWSRVGPCSHCLQWKAWRWDPVACGGNKRRESESERKKRIEIFQCHSGHHSEGAGDEQPAKPNGSRARMPE